LPKGTVIPAGVNVGVAAGPLENDTVVTIQGINELHRLGYTISEPLSSGLPFFVSKETGEDIDAGNIALNPAIVANLGAIAASSRTYDSATGEEKVVLGNGLNALNIANIRNVRIEFLGGVDQSLLITGNFDDFFRTLIGALGVQAQESERQELNQKFLVDQVDSRRQSVSGVSMDEEMADMVKFQHAYNAAARHMTTYDEMLDKIINGMGQVGR
jgi:flagellar hook-associated protein 1 FlgK